MHLFGMSSKSACMLVSVILLLVIGRARAQEDARPTSADWSTSSQSTTNRLLVMATIEDPNRDSFIRLNRSLEAFDLKLDLIRLESQIQDVKLKNLAKFEALKKALRSLKDQQDLVIMLLDGRDSIANGHEQEILRQFNEFQRTNGTRLLFATDSTCWPDANLAQKYPKSVAEITAANNTARRLFLNSKALIGQVGALWDLVDSTANTLNDIDRLPLIEKLNYDFQLYCTHIYLNTNERNRLKMELDERSSLFASLDEVRNSVSSASGELELEFLESADRVGVKNLVHNTRPLVVLSGGSGKHNELNSLGNYLGKAWTPRDGCRHCNSTMISLTTIKDSDLPKVLIGVFIEEPTPFLENFFTTLRELNYTKTQLHLFIHNNVEYHTQHVAEFLEKFGANYASSELVDQKTGRLSEAQARDYALLKCKQLGCDYYLSLDSLARLEEPNSLRHLIETNRTIVAPLLSRPGKLWSNFWGAITPDGYYERSHDYVDLVTRERLGVWNVPLVMNAYLIEGKFLRNSLDNLTPEFELSQGQKASAALTYFDARFADVKPVLIFSRQLRTANIFQFVTNTIEFGHLIDPTNYNTSRLFPDFYELTSNKHDWEREYLHENFTDLFDERDEDESHYPNRIRLEQPCPDVYWFPVVSERFCDQLVAMMEQFNQWSSGTNSDPRIEGGYESVPTRDIHFKQVGLHDLWLYFLREYIMPIQLKEYIGYEHDPPRTDLAFVVRYHPSEQPSLRPHHDSSTYTLNIALNAPGRDYEGGGCRFVRYNCSVTESRKGWALIHPGRLTHYHEGLPVTKGTRYILVTFVDP